MACTRPPSARAARAPSACRRAVAGAASEEALLEAGNYGLCLFQLGQLDEATSTLTDALCGLRRFDVDGRNGMAHAMAANLADLHAMQVH
jgi:hypothetical protein